MSNVLEILYCISNIDFELKSHIKKSVFRILFLISAVFLGACVVVIPMTIRPLPHLVEQKNYIPTTHESELLTDLIKKNPGNTEYYLKDYDVSNIYGKWYKREYSPGLKLLFSSIITAFVLLISYPIYKLIKYFLYRKKNGK